MFGIKFIKVQPTTYLLQYRGGKIVREGLGLSFFYYAPTTSLVAVPVASADVPFIFHASPHKIHNIWPAFETRTTATLPNGFFCPLQKRKVSLIKYGTRFRPKTRSLLYRFLKSFVLTFTDHANAIVASKMPRKNRLRNRVSETS